MKVRNLAFVVAAAGVLVAATGPNAQIERGRQLFLHSAKGTACATCHALEGTGTAVGPDLTRLGAVIGPRGLVMTIQMSMTAYVQEVQLSDGRTFPGIQVRKDGDSLEIYDLSAMPPKLWKGPASEVAKMSPNTQWKHPPTEAGYEAAELTDIIAFIKYASTGVTKPVTEEELN